MIVTKCDRCKIETNPQQYNEWVEVRYSTGRVARFTNAKNEKVELCFTCFKEFMNWNNK